MPATDDGPQHLAESDIAWRSDAFVDDLQSVLAETLAAGYETLDAETPRLSAPQVLAAIEGYAQIAAPLHASDAFGLLRGYGDGLAALVARIVGRPVRRLAIAPCSDAITPYLPLFFEAFDEVLLVDNWKAGQQVAGRRVVSLEALAAEIDRWDAAFVPTPNAEVIALYVDALPAAKVFGLAEIVGQYAMRAPAAEEQDRYAGIHEEIAAAENPVVFFSGKLNVTLEPTLLALEAAGFDVFVITRTTRFHDARVQHDADCPLRRNFVTSLYGFLYLWRTLKACPTVLFYDFFLNVGWDARNAAIVYAYVAGLLKLCERPAVLGCYDVIKPVCLTMGHHEAANAFYGAMLDAAGGIWLNSKSDDIGQYLRDHFGGTKPVLSFYRYAMPPRDPLMKLSTADGAHHIVGVTSFFGESFEPNRAESGHFIREILRQKIHFHYYSSNRAVYDYYDALDEAEQPYFHIHDHIWDQAQLARDMSKYDAGWLVGDEGTVFEEIAGRTEDSLARDLFRLFVPNGVPTSSMAYGAAGLPVFATRAITVLQDVFPKGCLVPLDAPEAAKLSEILEAMDLAACHQTMRAERARFDATQNIARLVAFLRQF